MARSRTVSAYLKPGLVVGRLLLLERIPFQRSPKNVQASWRVRCECGAEKAVREAMLVAGRTRSCGCLVREKKPGRPLRHGALLGRRVPPEYRSWQAMLQRCTNPRNPGYADYGGRGITVAAAWSDFATFLRDVGPRPSLEHTLDRIDNEGSYVPGNVRWATTHQQANNVRRNHRLTFNGRTQTIALWAKEIGISSRTLRSRLRRGWAASRVLAEPVHVESRNRRAA